VTTFPHLQRFESEVDGGTIDLPVRGKVYSFPTALPLRLGLKMTVIQEEAQRLKRATEAGTEYVVKDEARELVDDVSLHELYQELIGEEMLAVLEDDRVSWPETLHIGETLFVYHQAGLDVALMVWQAVDGEQPAEGDARPPSRKPAARSGSSRQKTSQRSSTVRKPKASKGRRSDGATSSTRGR
jgi:hypothetical protein